LCSRAGSSAEINYPIGLYLNYRQPAKQSSADFTMQKIGLRKPCCGSIEGAANSVCVHGIVPEQGRLPSPGIIS
jgi:hypothetical protein